MCMYAISSVYAVMLGSIIYAAVINQYAGISHTVVRIRSPPSLSKHAVVSRIRRAKITLSSRKIRFLSLIFNIKAYNNEQRKQLKLLEYSASGFSFVPLSLLFALPHLFLSSTPIIVTVSYGHHTFVSSMRRVLFVEYLYVRFFFHVMCILTYQ